MLCLNLLHNLISAPNVLFLINIVLYDLSRNGHLILLHCFFRKKVLNIVRVFLVWSYKLPYKPVRYWESWCNFLIKRLVSDYSKYNSLNNSCWKMIFSTFFLTGLICHSFDINNFCFNDWTSPIAWNTSFCYFQFDSSFLDDIDTFTFLLLLEIFCCDVDFFT